MERIILDPEYMEALESARQREGSLPAGHEWREVEDKRTHKVVKAPLPVKITPEFEQLVIEAECL
jgi:hypothetical protein